MAIHDLILQYLTTSQIGEKGQLTIPKEFREDLGLQTGAPFTVLRLGDGLILLPEQRRFEMLCDRVGATLSAAGVSDKELLATLPAARSSVYARRYGKKSSMKSVWGQSQSNGHKPKARRRRRTG